MASIVINNHNTRKNRINSEKVFEFECFGIGDSFKTILSGAFRDNIRVFLQKFADIEDYTVHEMPVWCTLFFSEDKGVFPLYTIQETIQNWMEYPFCHRCETSGWGHHFVCKRKYHLIIPVKEHWDEPLDWDFEETEYHNLYGLIHCNGYGHLICLGGLRNNSKFSADDNMNFWDRLCTLLKARRISASHFSTKEAVELSLTDGIVHGKSWFGKWGYKFSGGRCPEITEQKYNAAIQFLGSLGLEKLIRDFKNKRNIHRIKEMMEIYRKFMGDSPVTLNELLKFMLLSESRTPTDISKACKIDSQTGEILMRFETLIDVMTRDCRWSAKRLEDVLFVIVELLKQHKANSGKSECCMSRQELRDKARKSIGDTGLIDFVLKSIKCFAVENHIVCRATNPLSKLNEFTIYEISPGTGNKLGFDLSEDLMFLYENVLESYSQTEIVMHSIFVKDWPSTREVVNHSMELICKVLPSFDEMMTELTRPLSPGAIVIVEPQITIGDLKIVAQCALRDTYCIMDEFEVTQIGGLKKIEDEKVLHDTVEPGSRVWVRGRGLDLDTQLRCEDGAKKTRTLCNHAF